MKNVYNSKGYTNSQIYISRYVNKAKAASTLEDVRFYPKYNSRQVFTLEQEKLLSDYAEVSANMLYGITITQLAKLAYETAARNNIRMPENWETNKRAGSDWCQEFF